MEQVASLAGQMPMAPRGVPGLNTLESAIIILGNWVPAIHIGAWTELSASGPQSSSTPCAEDISAGKHIEELSVSLKDIQAVGKLSNKTFTKDQVWKME